MLPAMMQKIRDRCCMSAALDWVLQVEASRDPAQEMGEAVTRMATQAPLA